ncbi:MAG: dipeptide epimerase [Acidobacteria bacterium]|nr:MAG: dipeptide epimerase [Acidobacteriota bacterium]
MKYQLETKTLTLAHRFTIARSSSDEKHNVFVKLEKDGITGWGEAAPNTRYQETPASSTRAIEGICQSLPENLLTYTPVLNRIKDAVSGEYAAKAAVDMAVMDWVGKSLGLPLYKLWGLDPADIPATSMTIAIASPEEMKKRALEASEYHILKVKLGSGHDRELIDAIRSVSSQTIRIDANEGWRDREMAIREIEWLAARNVELIEQPMPASQEADMQWLKQRSPLPLIADEAFTTVNSIYNISECYHGINIKLMKCGGTLPARESICLARSLGLSIMLGCMIESSVAIAAAAHMAPLVDFADLDGNLLIDNDPFQGHKVENGAVLLAREPGLGVQL